MKKTKENKLLKIIFHDSFGCFPFSFSKEKGAGGLSYDIECLGELE